MLIHGYESKDIRKRAPVSRRTHTAKPYNQETFPTIDREENLIKTTSMIQLALK